MSTIHHRKLIRDLIPQIIEGSGKTCVTRILPEAEYLAALDAKLQEELNEYQAAKSMEELADLLEVMMAVAEARGIPSPRWRPSAGRRPQSAVASGSASSLNL